MQPFAVSMATRYSLCYTVNVIKTLVISVGQSASQQKQQESDVCNCHLITLKLCIAFCTQFDQYDKVIAANQLTS